MLFSLIQKEAFEIAGCLDKKTEQALAYMKSNDEIYKADMQVALYLSRIINSNLNDLQKMSQILAYFGYARLEKYGPIQQVRHLLQNFMTNFNFNQHEWSVLNSLIYQTRLDLSELNFNLNKIKKHMSTKFAFGFQICPNHYYSSFRR